MTCVKIFNMTRHEVGTLSKASNMNQNTRQLSCVHGLSILDEACTGSSFFVQAVAMHEEWVTEKAQRIQLTERLIKQEVNLCDQMRFNEANQNTIRCFAHELFPSCCLCLHTYHDCLAYVATLTAWCLLLGCCLDFCPEVQPQSVWHLA